MKKAFTALGNAFVLWALCGTTMMIGLEVTTENNAIIIHAVGAPIYSALISYIYYKKFNYTTVFETASAFVLFVILTDAFLVAPIFNGNYKMFTNIWGT